MRTGLAAAIALTMALGSAGAQGKTPLVGSTPLSRDAPVHFRWAAGGVLTVSPLAAGGIVYCVSEDRSVNALGEDGKLLYHSDFRLSRRARYAPTAAGALLVADGSRILKLNKAGRPGFSIELSDSGPDGFLPPVEGWDGRLFVAGKNLSCVSITGAIRWIAPLPDRASAGPVLLPDGSVAVGLENGGVVAYSPFSEPLGGPESAAGGAARGLAVGKDGLACLRADGGLSRIILNGGERLLARDVQAFCADEEAGTWIVLKRDGGLASLDAEGRTLWTARGDRDFDRVKAYPGRVYALGKRSVAAYTNKGILLKEMGLSNNAVPPEVSEAGIVYSCGKDWIVYAYLFDPDRPSDYGLPSPSQSGNYGLLTYDRGDLEWRLGISEGENRAALLDEIEKSLKSATIGSDEREIAGILSAIALAKVDGDAGKTPKRASALYPEERARACALLGSLGSRESRDVLIVVAREDGEDLVRAAAIEGLGAIGWDADGRSLAAIREACGRIYVPGKERTMVAAAGAIERIIKYEGVPASDDGVDTLLEMAGFPAPPVVRARVVSALKAIMRP